MGGSGVLCFFFQAEDGIRYLTVTGVQTCALPICGSHPAKCRWWRSQACAPPRQTHGCGRRARRCCRPSPLGAHGSTATSTPRRSVRSEEHTSELQSQSNLVCRLLLEKKKNKMNCC